MYGRERSGLGLVREKWSGSSRPECGELSRSGPIVGTFLQYDANGPLRVIAGYIPTLLAGRVYPSPMEWHMENRIMAQRCRGAARNLSQEGKSWYLGVQIDKFQPRRKELIFGGVQTDKSQSKRKELIFGEVQTSESQPKRKELISDKVATCNLSQ